MYISPRLPRFDKGGPKLRHGGRLPLLAFALYALLAMAGTLLLGAYGITAPELCMEDLAAACVAPSTLNDTASALGLHQGCGRDIASGTPDDPASPA